MAGPAPAVRDMNRAQRRQAARKKRISSPRNTPVSAVSATPANVPGLDIPGQMEIALRLHRAGDLVNAAQIYQRVITADRDHADALHLLGVCAGEMSQPDTALGLIDRSIQINPQSAQYHNNRGNVLTKARRQEEAIESYRRAVAIDGNFAQAWNNLGVALGSVQRIEDAMDAFRRAIEANADYVQAHDNLAGALHLQGNFEQAEASYRRAIEVDPDYFLVYSNLANTLSMMGRAEEAIAMARRAVEIDPSYAGGYGTLGMLLQNDRQFAEANAAFRQSLELDPDSSVTWNNYGNALRDLGGHAEAIVCFRKALEIDPHHITAHSNLLFCMGMHAHSTGEEIFAESRRWDEAHAAGRTAAASRDYANDRNPDRRLRIGYVSPDFRDHSVSHFVEPLFDAHDRDAVELFAYAHVPVTDDASDRIRKSVDGWCETVGMTYAELADRIRADGIDILVDLAGHTAGNRLPAFAGKPAPVLASWLGYGGTTGLGAMDYRITDAVTDPEGVAEAQHTETLARLPNAFLCYRPPEDAPEVGAPPSVTAGHITFASFNSLAKVTPEAASTWARVLDAVPGSRLIIKGSPFTDADIRGRYVQHFAAAGIDEDRVELLAQLPSRQEYLAVYNRVDIVLDTFPYNGGTTTCEALWMGVPVVTLYGDRTVSRMSAGMLGQVGMSDLVAQSEADYIGIAAGLAGDPARLAELRAGLRPRMQESPLCDAPAFARAMEAAYRDMWRRWTVT